MPSLKIETEDHRLRIIRARTGEVMVVQNCAPDQRPYIHPLTAPDGVGALTEDRPAHHPWQHGLYVGLNDVNGHGFWCEGLLPSYQRDGTFHPVAGSLRPLHQVQSAVDNTAAWQFECLWRGHEKQPLIAETQQWSFCDHGETTTLDFHWTIRALADLQFGKSAYGGLFLRMPFQEGCGGEVLTSESATSIGAAEQHRARWVAVSMRIPDRRDLPGDLRVASITIMDHPVNPEHPVPWRVDGQLGIAPSRCAAGAWSLAKDQSVSFRHRVMAQIGRPDAGFIDLSYAEFSRSNAWTA